jgi:hypothetical protein
VRGRRPAAPDPLAPLARSVLRRVLLVALVLGGGAALLGHAAAGSGGGASALLGTALGAVLVGGGVPGLRRPRGRSPLAPVAASLALRLVLYAAALALVSRAAWIHGPSLALATAASVACLLAVGLHAVSRGSATVLELDDTTRDDTTRRTTTDGS